MRCVVLIIVTLLTITSHAAIVLGNPHGTIQIAEVYDYECPHCHRMAPVIQQIIHDNPDLKVKFYPVAILNETSLVAATAAIVMSHYPQAFLAFHNELMQSMPITSDTVKEALQYQNRLTPAIILVMHSQDTEVALNQGLLLLKFYHQTGVPLFLITATHRVQPTLVLNGEQSLTTLQGAIQYVRGH